MKPWRLGLLLLTVIARAQDPLTLSARLDDIVSAALKQSGAPSVSIAVTQNRKIVYAKAFGKADIASDRSAGPTTRYAVGSVSKQFTAAAILLLQQQGKLSLDDKVSKYFPALTRANEVTLRQLLSHTAGYEDYAPQDYIIPEWTHPTTPQAVLDRWAKKPLNFDPGTRWQYSNTNYVLAGEIFERASGLKLVDFLRQQFFNPLGMNSASDCDAKSPEDATAYTRFAMGPPRPVAREAEGWYFAAGELCMVPSDLARWDIALLEKKFLTPASYDQFTRETKLANGNLTHYALGLEIGDVDNIPMFYHGGEVSGFLSLNEVFPTRDVSVTVLSNEDGVNLIFPVATQIAKAVMEPVGPDSTVAGPTELSQVKGILEGLRNGTIDRAIFTANANSYFTDVALGDIRTSLQSLGNLKTVARRSETLRGGMTHRSYRAEFETKSLSMNIYVMPDGKYEQFLIEEEL